MTKQKEKKEIIKNCSTIIDELENMCFKKPNTKQKELKKAFLKKCFHCGKEILFDNELGFVSVCDSCYRDEKERRYLNENVRCACGGIKSFESNFCKECI